MTSTIVSAPATLDQTTTASRDVDAVERGTAYPNGRWLGSAPGRNALANAQEELWRIVEAAQVILAQGEDLLRALSLEDYKRRVPVAFNASIGGHYRHCLDHFTSLLRGLDADEVDYDHRERDVRLETQPEFALALTSQLRAQLARLPVGALETRIQARCEVSYAPGASPVTGSSFGRELVYSIAHAIHHYALISVMARLLGAQLPEHFGIAPSTLANQHVSPPR